MKNEAAYNPRILVPNASDFTSQWSLWAAETRPNLPFETVPYGDHARETMDIFHATRPKGTIAFIHGGYFRAFSKDDFSWVADRFVEAGYTTAILSYPLCPEVSVQAISHSCYKALKQLGPLDLVFGHSAGGYLTAFACESDLPIKTGLSISGVFDLTPLVETSMNEAIRLTRQQADAWSLTRKTALACAVGSLESPQFIAQSQQKGEAHIIKNRNHFDVIEELRIKGSPLLTLALKLTAF